MHPTPFMPDFSKARILIVGDVMLDRYWYTQTTRISPEAPVPVSKIQRTEERAGGAGNVALNIASLGGQVCLLGLIGHDEAADTLAHFFDARHIQYHLHPIEHHPTIVKLRVLSQHQQLIRLDFEEKFSASHAAQLLKTYETLLPNYDVVILSDYGKGVLSHPQSFISAAKHLNKPIFVDPKQNHFDVYAHASVITPNFKEFEAVVGPCHDEQEIKTKAHELIEAQDLSALLITRGEHGMSLFRLNQPDIHIPTQAQEVFDVTGAGDTVIAVLAAAMATGLELPQAVHFANAAAGIVVSKLGAATVTSAELRRTMFPNQKNGILNEDELLTIIEDAHEKGETVIMTNGCFDILHAGHIRYLTQAKALGDRLIIAVNDDDSVRRLKGAERPINPIEDRLKVLAALSVVDWVISFSEDTPERIISKLLPDILVKGGDWKVEQIAGAKAVLNHGGQVKILDFMEGRSTTRIVDKLGSVTNQ